MSCVGADPARIDCAAGHGVPDPTGGSDAVLADPVGLTPLRRAHARRKLALPHQLPPRLLRSRSGLPLTRQLERGDIVRLTPSL